MSARMRIVRKNRAVVDVGLSRHDGVTSKATRASCTHATPDVHGITHECKPCNGFFRFGAVVNTRKPALRNSSRHTR
jgi:hypothetical protein